MPPTASSEALISKEMTFPRDTDDRKVVQVWLLDLVGHLGGRLRPRVFEAGPWD